MDPDQIQNPNFESDSGWKFVPGSEQVSGGYTDTWKSEGAKSYKIALHGDSQCRFFFEPGQRSSIVQSVDLSGVRQIYFDLNLLPPFAYSGTGIGAMRVEARIDKDVFYTFNQETGGEQLNQSILLAPGKYSGRHNLAISLMVYSNFCSYGNNQIDSNAMYVDNIRFYQDQVVVPTHTPTATPPSLSAAKDYASKLEIPVNQDGSLDLSSEDSLKTIDVVNLLAFIDQVLPNIKAMEALRRQDNPITIKSGGNLHVLDMTKKPSREFVLLSSKDLESHVLGLYKINGLPSVDRPHPDFHHTPSSTQGYLVFTAVTLPDGDGKDFVVEVSIYNRDYVHDGNDTIENSFGPQRAFTLGYAPITENIVAGGYQVNTERQINLLQAQSGTIIYNKDLVKKAFYDYMNSDKDSIQTSKLLRSLEGTLLIGELGIHEYT